MWKKTGIVLGILALALFAYAIFLVVWATRAVPGKPGIGVRRAMEWVEKFQPQDGSPNAYPALIALGTDVARAQDAVVASLPKNPTADQAMLGAGWPYDFAALYARTNPPDALRENTLKVAAAYEGVEIARRLDDAAQARRFVRDLPPGVRSIDIDISDQKPFREIARFAAWKMSEAHRAGDGIEMAKWFERSFVLARACMSQATLLDRLVGAAISALATSRVRECLTEKTLDATGLEALLAAMDRQDDVPPIELALEGERSFFLDTVDWTHSDDGNGDGHLLVGSLTMIGAGPPGTGDGIVSKIAARALSATKKQTLAEGNRFYDDAIQISKMSASAGRAATIALDQRISQLPRKQAFVRILATSLNSTIGADLVYRCHMAGTRAMLRIELHHAKARAYPDSLDTVANGSGAKAFVDPMVDRPLIYRRIDPRGDPFGRSYLLYSVGADGVDNGGLPHPTAEGRALKGDGAGYDFVFNRPTPVDEGKPK